MSSSKSEDVQRWRAAVCEAVASMTPDPNGKFMRYQDHVERLAEVTAERDALLAEAIVSERQVVLEARLARVTAERDLLFDEGARKGQALAEVTAERDQLRNATHVASYERGIAEGRNQSEHNLNRLLDAVEAWRDSYSRPLREPYNEALAKNAAIAMVNLAAKIRKERS